MPVTDASSNPQIVWWRRRPFRFSLAAFAAVMLILWGCRLYYKSLSANPVNLEVSSSAKFLVETDGAVRIKLVDSLKNKPLPNVPIEVELVEPSTNRVASLVSFSSDASGSGPAQFRLPAWNEGNYKLRITAKPESGPEVIEKDVSLERSMKIMLSTDKPLYQPGQTIHLRALALRRPDLKPVGNEVATVTVVDPKGNVVFKHQPTTSQFGIVSADFQLADEVIEGSYTLAVNLRGTESRLNVEIRSYVLPKFKIDITTDQPHYRPGQTVKGKIKATYFFGKPVTGEVILDSSPRVVQKSLKLDEKGEATFDAVLTPNQFSQNPQRPDFVTFSVKATDSGGQENTKSTSRNVAAQDLLIEAIPEGGTIVAGMSNRIYLLISRPDGQPVKANVKIGEATLQSNELGVAIWEATPEGGILSPNITATDAEKRTASRSFTFAVGTSNRDFLMRADRSIYAAGEPLKLTFQAGTSEPIFVDLLQGGQVIRTASIELQEGKGELALDLPPDWFGSLEVLAYRVEVTGQVIRKKRSIFVRPATDLTVQASLESLGSPKKEPPKIGASTFRPGEKARITLSLQDAEGKPAPGAISLAAVDEAVFNILEDRPGFEKQFFLGNSNESELPSIDELVGMPELRKEADRSSRHEALFARSARTLPPIQATALKSETYPLKVKQTEDRRKSGLEWVAEGWRYVGYFVGLVVMILALFGIQRLVSIYVDSPTTAWQIAVPAVGMILVMIVIISASPEYRSFKDAAAAKTSDLATGRAIPKSGEKKSDSDPENSAGGEGVTVRQYFPETLLWKPELVTDNQGKVSVDLQFADSITSWRMTASGVNSNGQLGSLQSELIVFQPFFVDLNLPVKLTRGDEIAVPVVVSNFRKETQKVKVTLKKSDWFELIGEPVQEVELKANEVKAVSYRIRANKVGRQSFEVLATSGTLGDAVQRVIEVVPNGKRVEQVVNGTLNNPAAYSLVLPNEAIEGSAKLFVKFYPSGFSQLVEGIDSIFQMPSGCFEQASSTTYPNILALDYLKRANKSLPLIEAQARQFINAGYQRLLTFEVPGGGFDWYGHAPANRTLTAYGLMEFRDMAKVHSVDPKLISRTRDWLLKQRKPDGSWDPESWNPGHRYVAPEGPIDLQRILTTAYISWSVFNSDERADAGPTKKFLTEVPIKSITDPYILALLANALLALDEKEIANSALSRLDELKQQSKEGDQIWWARKQEERTAFFGAGQSGDIETTALVVLAKTQAKLGSASIKPSLLWLTKQRDARGTWHTTQATVLTLKALLAASQQGEAIERKIDLAMGTKFKKQIVIPADQAEVVQQIDLSSSLQPGPQTLNLTETTKGETNFQVAYRYHLPAPEGKENGPFPILLSFDREKVRVGESIHATLRTINSNPRGDAPMVLLEVPVPVGFSVDASEFAKLVTEKKIERFQMQSDRVVLYLRGMKALDFFDLKYTLKAVIAAKVTVNGAKVYEYYDPAKMGISLTSTLEVTE